MSKEDFIERCFEIAFGDDAIGRDFKYDEVLERLEFFSREAHILERVIETIEEEL
jgi:hypothetical protein